MQARFGEILDTSRDARARYFDLLARLTPAERAKKVVGLGRAARQFARAGIRHRRPDASPHEVELELVARLYGPAVARMIAAHVGSVRG
jgi:hypothetical protein